MLQPVTGRNYPLNPLQHTDIVRWHQGVLNNTLNLMALEDALEPTIGRGLEALWQLPLPPLPVVHWRRDRPQGPSRCMLLACEKAAVLIWQRRIAHDGLASWQVEVVLEEAGHEVDAQDTRRLLGTALDLMALAFNDIRPSRRDKAFEQAGGASLLRGACWSLLSGQVTGTALLGPEAFLQSRLR